MIKFECPHCRNAIRVSEAAAGRQGTCNQCGKQISVPTSGVVDESGSPDNDDGFESYLKWLKIAAISFGLIASISFVAWSVVSGVDANDSQNDQKAGNGPARQPAPAEPEETDIASIVSPGDYLTYDHPEDIPQKVEFDGKTWRYVGVATKPGIILDKLIPIMFTSGDRDTRLVIAYAAEGQDYFDEIKYTQIRTKDKYGESRWVDHGLQEHLMLDGSRQVKTNNFGKIDGMSRSWYPSGQIRSETSYRNGIEHGPSRGWWENGHKQYESVYKGGKEVSGKAFKEDGTEY